MQIRPAQKEDIPVIQKIAALTWPHAYAQILTSGQVSYMLRNMYSTETLHYQMATGTQQFLLGCTEQNAVGFAGFGPGERDLWKLHKLYVLPFSQKTGAGKKLLEESLKAAKAGGAVALILQVNRNNPAVSFYQRMGFIIEESADFDIGGGFFMNDYIMKKGLI